MLGTLFQRRPSPGEVFTPRHPLNEAMYVERRDLERRFQRAIEGSQHIAIFGDSGSGKTWLFQRVLKQNEVPYRVVDLSIALTSGIDNAFRAALSQPYGWTPESRDESQTSGLSAGLKAEEERSTQYTFADEPPFDKLVHEVAALRGRTKFLVFDNFEQVSDQPDIVRAVAGYIIRLDNPRFYQSRVRFLLVGVVSDMRNMLSRASHAETISNRIYELPEVKRLSRFEAEKVFRTGFHDLLGIEFEEDEETVIPSCIYYSGRNAQQIHEIGFNVACEARDRDWRIGWSDVSRALMDWAGTSLAGHTSMVQARLNKFDTRVQRRNQVLYCLAKSYSDDYSPSEVDALIRREFPHKAEAERLGIDQILRGLADGVNPILVKDASNNRYRFSHPKLRIAIRYVLRKDEGGDVTKNDVIDGPCFD